MSIISLIKLFDDNVDYSTLTSSFYWIWNEPVPIEGYDYDADTWFECNTIGRSYKFYQMHNPKKMKESPDPQQLKKYYKVNGV